MVLKEYLDKLEKEVILKGQHDLFVTGHRKYVPVRRSSLMDTKFGKVLGEIIDTDAIIAFEIYGLMRKSWGFIRHVEKLRQENPGQQIKSLKCPLVYFSQIRYEDIARLAPHLMQDFPEFKERLLKLRGFK